MYFRLQKLFPTENRYYNYMPGLTSRMARGGLEGGITDDDADDDESEFSLDDVLTVISNERRRYLLEYLQSRPGPVPLSDAAEQIAAWENDTTVEDVSYSQRKSVYTSLLQFHCPKMDELDVIEFEQRDATVELADDDHRLELEVMPDDTDVWRFVFGSLGVSLGVVLAAWSLSVPPFDQVRLVTVLGALLSAATVSAFIFYAVRTRAFSVGFREILAEMED